MKTHRVGVPRLPLTFPFYLPALFSLGALKVLHIGLRRGVEIFPCVCLSSRGHRVPTSVFQAWKCLPLSSARPPFQAFRKNRSRDTATRTWMTVFVFSSLPFFS